MVEASLTGHLVLSTLHTNSAPETVTRLLDMGMDRFNFGDSLLAVLAQRLVRKTCPDCRSQRPASHDEIEEFLADYMNGFGAEPPMTRTDVLAGWIHRPRSTAASSCTGATAAKSATRPAYAAAAASTR